MKGSHNHSSNTAFALKFLPANDELHATFNTYFDSGMSPSQASRHYRQMMEITEEIPEIRLANASINPTNRQVYYWFDEWRTVNIGNSMESVHKVSAQIGE